MKRLLLSLAAVALLMLPTGPVLAQSKIVAVSDTGPTSIKGQTWKLFEKLAREKSGGKANVEISFGAALYAQKDLVQALQLGAVQFISPVVGVYTGTFPKLTALVLPYLLPSPEAIRATMDDPEIGGVLLDDMRKKGIEPLAIWLNGPRDIGTTSQKPIILPSDIKGVTIRVPPGRNYVDTFKLLGANVTTMNWSEVPTALRQGVIDAVEPVPNAWVSSHLYESAKQITRTGYIWDFYIVATNKSWWDKLDAKTRDDLKAALHEATAWNWKNTNEENAKAYETMKAAGVTIHSLTPEQKEAWAKAVQPLWKSLGNELVGEKTMARLVQIGRTHP
jgi:C4-dicarboxylate-binding protein DctP